MSERVYQPESNATDYFLGDWNLCVRTNVLSRAHIGLAGESTAQPGERARVELENRLVLLLVFFIEHQGEVLGKERIIKTIWQGKVVNDDSLAVAISHLRKALGDNSRAPEYIKTLPGVGYQLIAKAGVVEPAVVDSPSEKLPASVAESSSQQYLSIFLVIGLLACIVLLVYLREQATRSTAAPASTNSSPIRQPTPAAIALNNQQQQDWQRAQQLVAGWSPEELKSAIQLLRELLQQVPDFAPAYAAIAEAKIKLLQEQLGQQEHCAEVVGLLNKSIALDAQQQKTLVTRGNVLFWCARNYVASEQDYLRAIQLNPNDDLAPMQYSQLLLAKKRFTESLQQVDKSRQLNPLNYSVPTVVWIYQMQQRDDLALKELERINSAEPGDRNFHISAQRVYARVGRERESLDHWLMLMRESGYSDADTQAVQTAFAEGGLVAVNRWLLARKDQVDLGQYLPPLSWARYAIAAGELDVALDYLEQSFALRQSPLLWGNVDPAYDPVRDQPRFQAIMQQLQQPELKVP